jgi:hypothetical protein
LGDGELDAGRGMFFDLITLFVKKKNQVQTVTQDAEIESFIFGAVLLVYVKVFH